VQVTSLTVTLESMTLESRD